MLRAGVAVTVVGLVLTVVAMVPLVASSVSLPPWFWFCSMLTGVGLAMVLIGLLRAARARGRRIVTQTRGGEGAQR
jgi:hypothetical protein